MATLTPESRATAALASIGKPTPARDSRYTTTKHQRVGIAGLSFDVEASPTISAPTAPLMTPSPIANSQEIAAQTAIHTAFSTPTQAQYAPPSQQPARIFVSSDIKQITASDCDAVPSAKDFTKPPPRCIANMQNLVIWPVTHYKATNKVMLCYRTLTRDIGQLNHNDDYIAERLRDELLPGRSRVRKWMLHINKTVIESPLVGCPGIINYIDVRTRFFDAAVSEALSAGIKQVVVVAAGFDTRAYRLGKPGVRFYEVDLPAASARKQELVTKLLPEGQYARPTFVGADLSRVTLAQALQGTGYNCLEPALFTVEGLTYYLPAGAVDALFACIGSMAAPGSHMVFDFLDRDVFERRKYAPGWDTLRLTVSNKGEPKLSALDPHPMAMANYLGQNGFALHTMPTVKEVAAAMLPQQRWSSWSPPLPKFYRYCTARRTGASTSSMVLGVASGIQ